MDISQWNGVWPQGIQQQYQQAMDRINGAQSRADMNAVKATYGQSTNPTNASQMPNASEMRQKIMGQVQGSMPQWFDMNNGINFEMMFDQILPGWRERFPQLVQWIANRGQQRGEGDSYAQPTDPRAPRPAGPPQEPKPTTPSAPVYTNSEAVLQPVQGTTFPYRPYPPMNPHYDTNEYQWNPQEIEDQINSITQGTYNV